MSPIIIDIGFTLIWTTLVVMLTPIGRRIDRKFLQPTERHLTAVNCPTAITNAILALLNLSIIPLGGLWLVLLCLSKLT